MGLLKPIHGRSSCIPLAFGYYLRRRTLSAGCIRLRRKALVFSDNWFGNNGLLGPLRSRLGKRVHLLSRLRVNAVLYALPEPALGKASQQAAQVRQAPRQRQCAKRLKPTLPRGI